MKRNAFTLVELLVVIAIIGLLSTVAVVATSSTSVNARNQKRKSDLMQISKALELYYADNGAYPIRTGWFFGECGSFGALPRSGPNGWIQNLAPTYMAILPRDPTHNQRNIIDAGWCSVATRACYAYASDGIDYKVVASCTPEGTLSATDPFFDPGRPADSWAVYTPGARNW